MLLILFLLLIIVLSLNNMSLIRKLPTNLKAVVDPWVDVRAYGAKGDSVTDDTAAIQAAVNAGVGKTVFIPKGIYLITSSIDLPSYTSLCGQGSQSILKQGADNINILTTSAVQKYDIAIEKIAFLGNNTGTSNLDSNAIFMRYTDGIKIKDCRITHFGRDTCSANGINLYQYNSNYEIVGNYFADNISSGSGGGDLTIYQVTYSGFIAKNIFLSTGMRTAIYCYQGVGAGETAGTIIITDNIIRGSYKAGILGQYGGGMSYTNIIISNNIVKDCSWYGIRVDGNYPEAGVGGNITIIGNVVSYCAGDSESLNGGIMSAEVWRPMIITGNVINYPGYTSAGAARTYPGFGINIRENIGALVSGNTVYYASGRGINIEGVNGGPDYMESKIINNTVKECVYGIYIDGWLLLIKNLEIEHNTIINNVVNGTGIYLNRITTNTHSSISYNRLRGTKVADFYGVFFTATALFTGKFVDNYISNYAIGIYMADTIIGVGSTVQWERNNINSCTLGIYYLVGTNDWLLDVGPIYSGNENNTSKAPAAPASQYKIALSVFPRVYFDTAAPTTGTWAVGDKVINSTPVVGQPKGWVCTVAGLPGTWVSEGNL